MAGGILKFAVEHASLVEQIEECAPQVESRYLREAIERCKLPIGVEYMNEDDTDEPAVHIWRRESGGRRGYFPWGFFDSTDEAKRAYLNLCSQLLSPDSASSSQAETHGPDADNSAVVASAPAAFYSVARPLPLAAPEAATDAAGASPGASRTNSRARPS